MFTSRSNRSLTPGCSAGRGISVGLRCSLSGELRVPPGRPQLAGPRRSTYVSDERAILHLEHSKLRGDNRNHPRTTHPEVRRCSAGLGAAEASGRLEGGSLRPVAADPDRPLHERGHRGEKLSRALSEALCAIHRPGASAISSRRARARCIRPLEDFQARAKSAQPHRLRGHLDDRDRRPGHCGMGRAGEGGQPAARGASRRQHRWCPRIQQQRPVVDRRGAAAPARRRSSSAKARSRGSSCGSAANAWRRICGPYVPCATRSVPT